jgi:hypothetical protein
VRVNAVSPGMVPTETFFSALKLTEADLPRLIATVPLGRMGTPEDIAAAVLYLAAPASSWVTGQNLLVGGGREGGRTVEDRWRRAVTCPGRQLPDYVTGVTAGDPAGGGAAWTRTTWWCSARARRD